MTVKRWVFSRDFKLRVLNEIEAGKSQAQVAREHQINQQILECEDPYYFRSCSFKPQHRLDLGGQRFHGSPEHHFRQLRWFHGIFWVKNAGIATEMAGNPSFLEKNPEKSVGKVV